MTTIVPWPFRLRRGITDNPSEGACAMAAVNWLAHGEHGDFPACACPVVRSFVIELNDAMPDAALAAGPQGEPWSATQAEAGAARFRAAAGVPEPAA